MKRFTQILKWSLLLAYFPIIMAFVSASNKSVVCADVRVVVKDSIYNGFVSATDIRRMMLDKYPNMLGSPITKLDFYHLEQFVESHSSIRSCEIYNSVTGVVNVVVEHHKPILRVFAADGTYYLDENGRKIPVSKRFSARVLVANGAIPKDKADLVRLAAFIVNDDFWNAQMEQIYIRKNGDYVLVPRVGEQFILLGKPDLIEEKFRNLKALYTSGLNPRQWNEYKVINLKFKGQILCSRNREF